ncbi:hypothetical protein Pan97_05930 [Bremerella volcania]|uniref:Uncharacterized protein n=1 Tax=Bremerella volcania TaxID=2527984 RepID=A0A518C313_9BACT|nr:hypothetical protein [Bremerella volcania]QDU73617.1 hypothetical protein Pan97_05930 [Bremerella volcania]
MKTSTPRLALCIGMVALVLMPLAGCETPVATHPVTGTVMLANGSPAGGGIIKFRTTSEDGEIVKAHGQIQSDGSFRLTTFQDGDGALEGDHEVILFSPATGDGGGAVAVPNFPNRYRKYETSGLKFHVSPGENDFVIQLETR